MSFLDTAASNLLHNNTKGSIAYSLMAIANELKLIRQQLGHVLQEIDKKNGRREKKDED